MQPPIYLDYQTTTPLDRTVLEAMMPYLTEQFGDPASPSHAWGWAAEEAVDRARDQVAALIGAQPEEIVFTSGATESDNLAIKGIARAYKDQGEHLITQQTEHRAVLDSCRTLEREGFRVTYLPVDRYGLVDPEQLRAAITERTILVSIMHANNEVGTIQPLAESDASLDALGALVGLPRLAVWERLNELVATGLVGRSLEGDGAGLTPAGAALVELCDAVAQAAATQAAAARAGSP